jgi:lysophospholipase L1-like esterase
MRSRVLLALLASLLSVTALAGNPVRVLVYGDSNTWGWKPVPGGKSVPRYRDDQRWPGVMQKTLGSGYVVEVNGLIARTLDVDLSEGVGQLEGQDHNGMRRLALSLAEAAPVNLLIVMLGTNDLMDDLNRTPKDIASSLPKLIEIAKNGTVAYSAAQSQRLLVVIPPPLSDTSITPFKDLFGPHAIEKSKLLAGEFQQVGASLRVPVFNAGKVVTADGIDGLHLSERAHRLLGVALAKEVRKLASP